MSGEDSAGRYDFAVRQGNTKQVEWRMKDGSGEVVNLAGSVMRLTIKSRTGNITKSTADASLTMTEAEGRVHLTLSRTETRDMPVGAVTSYELERLIGGNEQTLMFGTITVERGVNADG